jgi:hypothetical protein
MTAQDHPSFGRPRDPTVKIWRYMSRDKLDWMLRTGALYFRRADKFQDPLEGHYTSTNPSIEDLWISHQIAHFGFGAAPGSEDELRVQYRRMLNVVHTDKIETFVNCWHMSERETPTMWQAYAADNSAVCIQSTFQLMHRLLPEQCFFGGVSYIDYKTDFIDPIISVNFISHKDVAYKHEREIRAVVWGKQTANAFKSVDPFGLEVPINLSALIEVIRVGPNAPPSYEHTIQTLASSHGLHSAVTRSAVPRSQP